VSACGSGGGGDDGGGASSGAERAGALVAATATASSTGAVELTIAAPAPGAELDGSRVTVRGTVVPADAGVQVLGKPAKVTAGVFTATARLSVGPNTIDVVATAPGAEPATRTVSVTRGPTRTQLAAARAARRKKQAAAAKRKRAAAAKRAAEDAATVGVPDEVGERLDVAESDVRGAGLRYSEIGGGTFGILVKSNWTVCEMRPAAGTKVAKRSRVKLIVDRDC
jgi:hypothetical protein